ncbi:MAG: hypothetical protein L6Q37_11305 [Bdellovibrionaceae bacterium]|nr:hypothetical protein [Pseudobdellovibrionaceae bacterium]NUM57809.1 hypothetical protein [Pseudobdellovibrionaceae bacterium]
MRITDLLLFLCALVGFILGGNYMLTSQLGRSPLKVDKLIESLKKNKDSDLSKALLVVTKKIAVEDKDKIMETPTIALDTSYDSRINHLQFLLGVKEYKERAIAYIESEIKSFSLVSISEASLVYLDKLMNSYFEIQGDGAKALIQLQYLKDKLPPESLVQGHLKNYEALYFQRYQNSPNK